MNPQAIMSALPWLRRIWKMLPPPARVPVLLVAAAIGVWQWWAAREDGQERPGLAETAPSAKRSGSGSGDG